MLWCNAKLDRCGLAPLGFVQNFFRTAPSAMMLMMVVTTTTMMRGHPRESCSTKGSLHDHATPDHSFKIDDRPISNLFLLLFPFINLCAPHRPILCQICPFRACTLSHCLFPPPDPKSSTVLFLQIPQPFHVFATCFSYRVSHCHPCHMAAPREVTSKVRHFLF